MYKSLLREIDLLSYDLLGQNSHCELYFKYLYIAYQFSQLLITFKQTDIKNEVKQTLELIVYSESSLIKIL